MTIYDLKRSFQNLLRPIVRGLAQQGVTANQVTLAALALSCGCGSFLYFSKGANLALLLLPLALFVRMALNAIDGMLAREHQMMSNLGAVLNELGDVLSDTVLYLPFVVISGISSAPVVLAVILAIVSELTGVVAVQIGGGRRYDGPMGKSDRAFVFGCIALLLGLGVRPERWVDIVLWLVVLLLAVTIVNRSRRALRVADTKV